MRQMKTAECTIMNVEGWILNVVLCWATREGAPDRLPDGRAIRACSNICRRRETRRGLWPILRTVENVRDFNGVFRDLINDYIAQG